ncbi:hypothetical protein IX324_002705 [Bacteroides pyogenes]|nr:hypothetical protein [Bacteroides pyogenes]
MRFHTEIYCSCSATSFVSVKVKKSKRLVARNWQEGEKTNSRRTDSGFFFILGYNRLGVLVKKEPTLP